MAGDAGARRSVQEQRREIIIIIGYFKLQGWAKKEKLCNALVLLKNRTGFGGGRKQLYCAALLRRKPSVMRWLVLAISGMGVVSCYPRGAAGAGRGTGSSHASGSWQRLSRVDSNRTALQSRPI